MPFSSESVDVESQRRKWVGPFAVRLPLSTSYSPPAVRVEGSFVIPHPELIYLLSYLDRVEECLQFTSLSNSSQVASGCAKNKENPPISVILLLQHHPPALWECAEGHAGQSVDGGDLVMWKLRKRCLHHHCSVMARIVCLAHWVGIGRRRTYQMRNRDPT